MIWTRHSLKLLSITSISLLKWWSLIFLLKLSLKRARESIHLTKYSPLFLHGGGGLRRLMGVSESVRRSLQISPWTRDLTRTQRTPEQSRQAVFCMNILRYLRIFCHILWSTMLHFEAVELLFKTLIFLSIITSLFVVQNTQPVPGMLPRILASFLSCVLFIFISQIQVSVSSPAFTSEDLRYKVNNYESS